MPNDPILNSDSVFGDAPLRQNYAGRSTLAVVMACIASFFILMPLGGFLGAGANLAILPELIVTEDEYLGGVIFLVVGVAIFALCLIGMILNKFRNYATNIMGLTYIVFYIIGFALLAGIYFIEGPAALN